jgi:putative ATP-binding cassette transporter
MTGPSQEEAKTLAMPPPATFDQSIFRQLWTLANAIRRTPGRGPLYLIVGGLVVVILATGVAQVVLNAWNGPFYDAIEHRQLGAFLHQILVFFEIAAVLLVLNVSQTGLNQALKVKLRQLATLDLIGNWMTQKRAARITRAGEIGVNPDQRIHEDARHLTEVSTDLGVGLLQSSILLVSFVGVLWQLSKTVVLHVDGGAFTIPGYLVWAALVYAATGSLLSWRVGRPLVALQATRYAREADLRVALVRGSEQADGIALNGGEADERKLIETDLANVLAVMRRIVMATVGLTTVTASYGWVALVVPILVAAPAYFGGSLTFGELMMVVGAFNQVQQALRWFVDNTGVIADWRATLLRVMNFRQALLDLDHFEQGVDRFERREHPGKGMALDDLIVMNFNGWADLSERHVEIAPGERVLIVGKPGAGKSTLFLSLAGIWNWGSGRISLPPAQSMMFLSQRPFIPTGSLREILSYPSAGHVHSDAEIAAVLKRIGLEQLTGALDRVHRWDRELIVGEQQRLAFARILLHKPDWIVSDEAFDMIDDGNRSIILSLFSNELAKTTVVSIGGSASGNGFYQRIIHLIGHAGQPPERADEPEGKPAERPAEGPVAALREAV